MHEEAAIVEIPELIELLEELANRVGFGELQHVGTSARDIPGGEEMQGEREHYLWTAPYSKILLLVTETLNEDALRAEINTAQNLLDDLLVSDENLKTKVIDGYLLVALMAPPLPEMLRVVREIELNTHLCRKHIFWPDTGATPLERWSRLLRSTVLGLPDSSAFGGQIEWPEFDESQDEAWRMISKSGSPAAAARKFLRESE